MRPQCPPPPPPPHLSSSVRGLLSFFALALFPILRGGRVLLFLVGAGLLLIALTACAGGGSETAASSPGTDTPPGTEPPSDNEPPSGNEPPSDTDTSIRGLDCLNEEGQDCDGDGHNDNVDIDDDGDGLIEIGTAAQLNAVRYALRGNGSRSSENEALDTTGCGGADGITNCSGYELIADISLAAYANADGGKGWRPLGHDTNDSVDEICHGARFDGTFEGNGFRISDLVINRPNEDCVGLFGQVAVHSVIRNFSLHAETIVGDDRVGGLAGHMVNATISSSSISIGNISGEFDVGGLVGDGAGKSTKIISSSVEAGKVSGIVSVGGLAGHGGGARIISSSVVAGEVSGGKQIGGLVGWGGGPIKLAATRSATIVSSWVVAGRVSGNSQVGGLVGNGEFGWIYSSSVVAGRVIGDSAAGGLVGSFDSGKLAYSYVVSGSNTPMLVGLESGVTGVASYWDSETSGRDSGNSGQPKTGDDLQMPADYEGIYAKWDNETDIFGDGENVPLAVWCDEDNSGSIEEGEKTNDNRVWDFGTSSQYPAINCTPTSPSAWRSWWSLEGTPAKPQLNQTRLDELLP